MRPGSRLRVLIRDAVRLIAEIVAVIMSMLSGESYSVYSRTAIRLVL